MAALREESDAAEAGRAAASAAHQSAVEARAAAEGNLRHWRARREALAMSLDESATEVPGDVLGAVDGALGLLVDLVEIDAGLEAAFAAAVGDTMSAVVVRHAAAARRVLHSLEANDAGAAVIALEGVGPAREDTPATSAVAGSDGIRWEPLRHRVRSSDPDVDGLLDLLLAAVVLVEGDWHSAADVWMGHPDVVAVTAAGDRLSSRGWRLGVHSAAGIRPALAEATERAEDALNACEQAEAAGERTRAELAERSERVDEIGHRLVAAEARAASEAGAITRLDSERRDLDTATGALRDHLAEISRRLGECASHRARIESRLPQLEAAEALARQRTRQAAEARNDIDRRAVQLAERAAEQSAADAGLQQRRQMLEERLVELQERLDRYDASRMAAGARLAALEREASVLDTLGRAVEERAAAVDDGLAEIRQIRRRHSEVARRAGCRTRRPAAAVGGRGSSLRDPARG